MGKLAEQYKAYLKQNGLGDKAPDKAENPKGFQEWNIKNRKRDRYHSNFSWDQL